MRNVCISSSTRTELLSVKTTDRVTGILLNGVMEGLWDLDFSFTWVVQSGLFIKKKKRMMMTMQMKKKKKKMMMFIMIMMKKRVPAVREEEEREMGMAEEVS
ncbi:hypothetical protein Tco_1189755 [Tanacetum coccineum]